jgi:hypothetical protein
MNDNATVTPPQALSGLGGNYTTRGAVLPSQCVAHPAQAAS